MTDYWKGVCAFICILVAVVVFLLGWGTLFLATMSIFQFFIKLGSSSGFVIGELRLFGIMVTSIVLSSWMMLKIGASIVVTVKVLEKIIVGEDKKDKEVKNKDEKTQSIEIEDVRIEE